MVKSDIRLCDMPEMCVCVCCKKRVWEAYGKAPVICPSWKTYQVILRQDDSAAASTTARIILASVTVH